MLKLLTYKVWPTKKHVNYLPWIHTRVTKIILCIIISMYVAIIQCWIPKKEFAVSISDTLWPWNKVRVIKPRTAIYTSSKVTIKQSLKDLALKASEKKPTLNFVQMRKCVNYFPWTSVKIKSSRILMTYLT